MDHRDPNHLSSSALEYEVADSKTCLQNHGISNVTIFAPPHGDAWSNATVIDMISKYYDYADNGLDESFFLHCDEKNKEIQTQKNCSTYNENNALNPLTNIPFVSLVIMPWTKNTITMVAKYFLYSLMK